MKLNPQQAPLYGQCVITVQLADEERVVAEEGVDYFLLFAGSTQRHLTSTLRRNHDILYALCPAHDCCEVVLVTLCSVSRGGLEASQDRTLCLGHVAPLAEHRFSFVQDLAFDMAQFLVSTAGRTDGLDGALLLDECQIPVQECERLDESLALALHHLVLPPGWSLLGRKLSNSTDLNPQETLLHFSARRGLFRVTNFLLRQSGARNALRLANREGHTPSTIAALRGHKRLQELLTKAETDAETDQSTEAAQLVSTDARVVCHLPRLNTHTLTVSFYPIHVVPTLQKSVEQLLHLICHLHAKGVSILELPFDSLHTADECCDGIETEPTCHDQQQLPDLELQYLDSTTGESCVEDCSEARSSSVVCGLSESWNAEKDWSLFVSAPKTEVRPQEHGVGPPEHWVCLSTNTRRDYCQMEEEEREQPFSTQALNVCDRSDGVQNKAGGENLTVGILTPLGCGKQAEETDKGETVIQEDQEATKGKKTSEPETEDITAGKEETISETIDLTTESGNIGASVMGQSSSSSSSDSEMNDNCKEGEDDGKEEIKMGLEHCSTLSLHEDKVDSEGLTDLLSTPGDLSSPSLIDCGDVMEGPESAVPCILIEGLHKGEPPPDVNSLEQNQETAVRDYTTEWDLAPETACHSGKFTEKVSVEELHCKDIDELYGYCVEQTNLLNLDEPDNTVDHQTARNFMGDIQTEGSPEVIPISSNRSADLDPGLNHGVSSDDDGSFKSVGSSTTEIFHPTQDSASTVDLEEVSSTEIKLEDSNGANPGETSEHPLAVDTRLPLVLGNVCAVTMTDCCKADIHPEVQLSPEHQTMGALKAEDMGEDLVPELSKEDPLLDPALSENTEIEETTISELNAGIEHLASDIPCQDLFEPFPSVVGKSEVKDLCQQDDQSTETSEKCAGSCSGAEDNGDLQLALQTKLDNSERTIDERSPDKELTHPETHTDASPSHSGNPPSDSEDFKVELPFPNSENFSVSPKETEIPKTVDTVNAASQIASQEVEVVMSEEGIIGAVKKERVPAEETDVFTIHRDREASFHQPHNIQHSGSSQSSASPSLPSRSSSATSCPSTAHRDSGSDIESFLNTEPGYDSVFRKSDEPVAGGDSATETSVSCSSTDDAVSVGPSSSSPDSSQGPECSWSPEEGIQSVATGAAGLDGDEGGGGAAREAEEAKDRVTEVPRNSCLLRNSIRSLSPLRRHSWGPGKNSVGDTAMNQRSSVCSPRERKPAFHRRSYSLEGLSRVQEELRSHTIQAPRILEPSTMPRQDSDNKGSLVSLTEEQDEVGEHSTMHDLKLRRYRPLRNSCPPMTLPLTKSVSMLAISQRDIDGNRSFSSTSGSVAYSISEEEPGPLRSDTEGKSQTTKVSRTFSYLKSKMYKKTREKDKDKKDKEKDSKEKDKKAVNGHLFTSLTPGQATQCSQCSQCSKAFNSKEAFHCTYCNASVHKGCRDSLPACAKVKMKPKQQFAVPDSSSFPLVTMRSKSGVTRDRPWSAILSPEDSSSLTLPSSRRHTSIMSFHGNNLSKSLSISNIAGPVFDEMPIKGLRYLSQSTDSLNRTNQVTESMESLTDEGTEMMDGQLMGEFESEARELEADSWSLGVEQQYLQLLDRELVKRQDVIYELMQTEMHHIRTLRIMSEVYSKGLQKEVQLELQIVEKLFPALDDLLELHTQHLFRLLERKRESQLVGGNFDGGFIINRIGDILISQFSGSNGETMKRVYGRFCSRHNEAVNFYKDLLTKDKRFKAFIKKKMSSSIVRRLGIPECILLVTQRITKYPVLIQRMLQHTKETEEDYVDLMESVRLVKEVIAVVDSKVNEHEKRRRLKEFHGRTDSKSIMMMKSGQIFAREDLLRRRLIHDGVLQLKNSQGRLKDVQALLLSDVFVFLQEKDQKYVFAMLDQRSTVISLQKLIVREVANEERGLFLITAGIEKPEMMEVLASSKDERNTWMQLIQDAMQSMDKDEDEGIPSETEDDKKQLETKAKEMRDLLKQKDTEIMSLLEEKVQLFRGMSEGLNPGEDVSRHVQPFFRSACSQEPPKGASVMKDALQEVETLQALVNDSLGGAMASIQEGGGTGPVSLPRRAETFGGFDSHQMHISKSGDRDESEDTVGDLRRTESDSVLKKGGNANVLLLLKRNSEQVLHSVSNLHLLLSTLQAVVVQQDSFIEDQRQALSERSSSCTSLSRASSRPSSLIEQEKQRSLEKQRQELASLQRQQAAHAEERRKREREWELREQQLAEREGLVQVQEEEVLKQHRELEEEKKELHHKKDEYQRDLERLRDAQRKLERDREAVQRQFDKMEEFHVVERTPSTTSDESHFPGSSRSLELDPLELSSSFPSLQPQFSKPKGRGLNPFTSSSNPNLKGTEANKISNSLLQLAKNKSKTDKEKKKKKKKGKGGSAQTEDPQHLPEPPMDGEIFFC